jgi:glycosyltransferase involved in cell wall biosynthesis
MMTVFNLEEDSWGVNLLRSLERWSIACAHQVVTVNIACRRIFGSRSCAPSKIGVVMNAPDGDIFPLRPVSLSTLPTRTDGEAFKVMYHGSLVERNGLDLAVDALARLRTVIPNAELRIYGRETPYLDAVMKDVRGRQLSDSVQYLGPKTLEELVNEIEMCDVGVIPNHRNAFTNINTPTRIFEYLALGTPVIAPRTPGIQDYFNEDSLHFFEPGDSEDLAGQLLLIQQNPGRAALTTERGQQVYLAHMWTAERQALVKLVSQLLNGASEHL